jgi:hypothetical protein
MQVEEKVLKVVQYHKRISAPTWGVSMADLRKLYIVEIRPIISYACAAWFVFSTSKPDMKLGLGKGVLDVLKCLDYKCHMAIAGARQGTRSTTLCKELGLQPIHIWLEQAALSRRVRKAWLQYKVSLRKTLPMPQSSLYKIALHLHGGQTYEGPYRRLFVEDCEPCEEDALAEFMTARAPEPSRAKLSDADYAKFVKSGRKWVRLAVRKRGAQLTVAWWKSQQAALIAGRKSIPMSLKSDWDCNTFSLSVGKDMTRAQTTMLLQLRTEVIGLRAHLKKIGVSSSFGSALPSQRCGISHTLLMRRLMIFEQKSDSGACPCGEVVQTVEHVMIHCPRLAKAREYLTRHPSVNTSDLSKLLSVHAVATTLWAIVHLDIDQFDYVKEEHQKQLRSLLTAKSRKLVKKKRVWREPSE